MKTNRVGPFVQKIPLTSVDRLSNTAAPFSKTKPVCKETPIIATIFSGLTSFIKSISLPTITTSYKAKGTLFIFSLR